MLATLDKLREQYGVAITLLRSELDGPIPAPNARQILGQIGGEARRYRQAVILILTDWATEHTPGAEPTKFRTQAWQKRVFGQSVSNNLAVRWCETARQCGERGGLQIPEAIEGACRALWRVYRTIPDKDLPAKPEAIRQLVASIEAAP